MERGRKRQGLVTDFNMVFPSATEGRAEQIMQHIVYSFHIFHSSNLSPSEGPNRAS